MFLVKDTCVLYISIFFFIKTYLLEKTKLHFKKIIFDYQMRNILDENKKKNLFDTFYFFSLNDAVLLIIYTLLLSLISFFLFRCQPFNTSFIFFLFKSVYITYYIHIHLCSIIFSFIYQLALRYLLIFSLKVIDSLQTLVFWPKKISGFVGEKYKNKVAGE